MDDLRKQLDKIDSEMRKLFEKRLDVVKYIGQYKKDHNLPILDNKREKEIIEKGLDKLENKEYKQYYQDFLNFMFTISKDLQSK